MNEGRFSLTIQIDSKNSKRTTEAFSEIVGGNYFHCGVLQVKQVLLQL